MGMSAGSFNTREFFHRASAAGAAPRSRASLIVLGFALPALAGRDRPRHARAPWPGSPLHAVQAPGLIADRWFFFAQAKHPQNLYYQVVS